MIVAKIPPAREDEDDAVESGATSEAMEKILLKRTPADDANRPAHRRKNSSPVVGHPAGVNLPSGLFFPVV
jgi:hypothetical protein